MGEGRIRRDKNREDLMGRQREREREAMGMESKRGSRIEGNVMGSDSL